MIAIPSVASLLFSPGTRPGAAQVRALAANCGKFTLSHDPSLDGVGEQGWVELLASGLTFDLTGLVPGEAGRSLSLGHAFGLPQGFRPEDCEVIALAPGPHLAGGGTMFPVIRCLAWLTAHLTELPGIQAVAWHPARAFSDPTYFRRGVLRWVEGGAFPGLGLAALEPTGDGGMVSEGLALFTGQELRLAPSVASDRAEGAKVALRLLDWLVEHGTVTERLDFTGPSGESLILEPVENSAIVAVWRGSH